MSIASLPEATRQLSVKSLTSSPAMQKRFEEVLGSKAPSFLAALTSQVNGSYLEKVDPKSVVAAAFIAATLDLPINRELGMAWVVPYKDLAQFQIGYRGYVQLAQRSGRFRKLNAFYVNAEMLDGFDECGEPKFDFSKMDPTKDAVGYGCVFVLDNGFTKSEYWTKERVTQHAKRFSQSFTRKGSPWQEHFDSMALKTVLSHTLRRWAPLSVELQIALRHDQAAHTFVGTDAEVHYVDTQRLLDVETKSEESVDQDSTQESQPQ